MACWAVIFGASAGLLWLFWSLLWPFNLLESTTWGIANKIVPRGESVLVVWSGCRHTDLPAEVLTQLEGSILIALPTRISTGPIGCQKLTWPLVYVGHEIPLGTYKARTTVVFRVNAIRTVTYTFKTEEFTVVE